MQDRPSAPELVAAVSTFLEREMIPSLTDPRLRFRALVAANLLNIVSREMELGEAQLQAEWERLRGLNLTSSPSPIGRGESDVSGQVEAMTHELCALIRAGNADEGAFHKAVMAHVERTVIEKLEIANPRFLDRVRKET